MVGFFFFLFLFSGCRGRGGGDQNFHLLLHLRVGEEQLLGLLRVSAVHLIHPPLAPPLLVPPVGQRQDQPQPVLGRGGDDEVEPGEAVVGEDAEPGLEGAGHLRGVEAVLVVAEGEDAHGAVILLRCVFREREREEF